MCYGGQKVWSEAPGQYSWLVARDQCLQQWFSLVLMPEQVLLAPKPSPLDNILFIEVKMKVALLLLQPIAKGTFASCGDAREKK
jgi:hypothetical protein